LVKASLYRAPVLFAAAKNKRVRLREVPLLSPASKANSVAKAKISGTRFFAMFTAAIAADTVSEALDAINGAADTIVVVISFFRCSEAAQLTN
jgi:hypothetical protein